MPLTDVLWERKCNFAKPGTRFDRCLLSSLINRLRVLFKLRLFTIRFRKASFWNNQTSFRSYNLIATSTLSNACGIRNSELICGTKSKLYFECNVYFFSCFHHIHSHVMKSLTSVTIGDEILPFIRVHAWWSNQDGFWTELKFFFCLTWF